MKEFIRSFLKSFSDAFAENEYVIRFQKKYPRQLEFVKKRLSRTGPYGLPFTVGIALSILFFGYFLGIAQDVLSKDPFVEADVRIMNLVADFRSLRIAKILLLFTYLGNWQVIVSLGILVVLLLVLLRRKRLAMFFAGAIASGEITYSILKLLLHRTRPNIGYSLTPREGFAFPSGHATVSIIFYGMIGCLIYRACTRWWQKLLTVVFSLALIFLIGFSRIYLGVHWSSDVVAGWSIGLSILILLITILREHELFMPEMKKMPLLSQRTTAVIAIILLFFEGLFVGSFYRRHPLEVNEPPASQPEKVAVSSLEDLQAVATEEQFPKFSETIVGEKIEPISFIVVGSAENLHQSFEKAGWFVAEREADRLPRLAVAALFNRPYPTAPVTPSFLNARPETIAFEKPTDLNTVRQRHHIRFWLTNYFLDSAPVWVATASFDDGLRYFITHKIRPDIDAERDFIKDELLGTGLVQATHEIQLVKPLLGSNQNGDQFFTDGKAYVMLLKQ